MLPRFGHVRLFAPPWTVAFQGPLSVGFSRQGYWSGLPFPPPGDLPDPGIEPTGFLSPALAGGFFTTGVTWEVLSLFKSTQNSPLSSQIAEKWSSLWSSQKCFMNSWSSWCHGGWVCCQGSQDLSLDLHSWRLSCNGTYSEYLPVVMVASKCVNSYFQDLSYARSLAFCFCFEWCVCVCVYTWSFFPASL